MPPFFRQSTFSWQCDKCKIFFKAGKGGVCPSCKRALCDEHLYGSFIEKVKARLSGVRAVCVECRAAGN
ncbi:MAG TPA: hypothetical protein VF836_02510 [Gemmatimonadaceae bacterium]